MDLNQQFRVFYRVLNFYYDPVHEKDSTQKNDLLQLCGILWLGGFAASAGLSGFRDMNKHFRTVTVDQPI